MSSLYPSRVRPLRKGTHKKRTCSSHEQTADSKRKSPKYGGKKYAIARNVFPIRKESSPIGPFQNLGHYPFRSASNPMASTAFISSSASAFPLTTASPAAWLTVTSVTPSTLRKARSTAAAQWEQVMPRTTSRTVGRSETSSPSSSWQ